MLSLGIATAVRDTAVSIGVVLGLLYVLPILAQAVADPLRRHLQQIAPTTAGAPHAECAGARAHTLDQFYGLFEP